MKILYFIFYFLITPSIMHGSLTKEDTWTWNIVLCNQFSASVRACASGTYVQMLQGTISDPVSKKSNIGTLVIPGIAQSIDSLRIEKYTIFLIASSMHRQNALVYDEDRPKELQYFDIEQPSKIFSSDPEIIQKLKQHLQNKREL